MGRMNAKPTAIDHPDSCNTPLDRPEQIVSGKACAAVARLSSQVLFAGALEVEIDHNGSLYRLRQTALGKLILTK